jgi:hypothetical protein
VIVPLAIMTFLVLAFAGIRLGIRRDDGRRIRTKHGATGPDGYGWGNHSSEPAECDGHPSGDCSGEGGGD